MVEDRLVTDVGGTIGIRVLSTPGMIAMMERCASVLAYENLPDGRATVGFEVCVKHVAAAAEGAGCRVRATPARGRRQAQAALRRRGHRGRADDRRRHPRAPRDRGRQREVELKGANPQRLRTWVPNGVPKCAGGGDLALGRGAAWSGEPGAAVGAGRERAGDQAAAGERAPARVASRRLRGRASRGDARGMDDGRGARLRARRGAQPLDGSRAVGNPRRATRPDRRFGAGVAALRARRRSACTGADAWRPTPRSRSSCPSLPSCVRSSTWRRWASPSGSSSAPLNEVGPP